MPSKKEPKQLELNEQHSRPFFLGDIRYYNKKDKLTQIYPSPKIRDN